VRVSSFDPFSSLITGSFIFLTSAPGIDHPDLGFLLVCSCRACEEPTGCECQEASEFVDEMGRPMHAYTPTVSNKSCKFLSLTSNLIAHHRVYSPSMSQRTWKLSSVTRQVFEHVAWNSIVIQVTSSVAAARCLLARTGFHNAHEMFLLRFSRLGTEAGVQEQQFL